MSLYYKNLQHERCKTFFSPIVFPKLVRNHHLKTCNRKGSPFLSAPAFRVCPNFQILTSSDDGDEKAITAMGVLNTLETILSVMDEKEEVRSRLEPVILEVKIELFYESGAAL